jgi:hypothetical protein
MAALSTALKSSARTTEGAGDVARHVHTGSERVPHHSALFGRRRDEGRTIIFEDKHRLAHLDALLPA